MKKIFWGIIAWIMIAGCRHDRFRERGTVIALQPLNHYDIARLDFVKSELEHFFHKKVVVLPEQEIPPAFINTSKGKRYHSNRMLAWLSKKVNDTIACVAAFTSEDIYTVDKDKWGRIKKPESKYAVWGIFGLGECPGDACVISDKRLATGDKVQFRHRLRTVAIHEVGHNLGLPHCINKGCIMSDANEKIATIDHSGMDFCPACKHKAGLQ